MSEILKWSGVNNFITPVIKWDETVKTNIQLLLANNQIQIPHFIEVSDDEIYVNLELINFREEIIAFFDEIFKELFFEDLDYKIFDEIIFNFDKLKSNSGKIKIAKSIVSFDKNRRDKYQRPNINWNKSAEYTFSRLYEEINNWWKVVEVEVKFNIDEFIAAMWNFWIKHWLKIEEIKKAFNESQISRITIAEFTNYVPWIDARFLSLVKLWVDHQLKRTKDWNFDLQEYERVFPQIQANTKIYQKIEKVPGQNWMDILWRQIIAPQVKDKSIFELIDWIDSWLKIEKDSGIDFIVAEKDWYIVPLQWYYDSKKYWEDEWKIVEIKIWEIINKLKLTSELTLWIVWPNTWRINTFWKVFSKWVDSTYSITCWESEISGEVNWCIYAKNDIKINWNVSWWNHTRTWKNWAITIIDWQIISEQWNIELIWNAFSKSLIKALKWNIDIGSAEESIIIWKEIRAKNARKTIFIWDNITIEGNCNDCLFIVTKNLNIQSLTNNDNNENIVFVCKANNDIENQYNEIQESIDKLKLLIENISNENNSILNDKKFLWYRTFKEKLENDKNAVPENIKKLLNENESWYNTQIEKLRENNNKLITLNNKLDELKEQVSKLAKIKNNTILPRIIVKNNKWEMKIFLLDINWKNNISELSEDDVKKILDIRNFLAKKYFNYSSLKEFWTWSILWQLNS